MGVKGLTTFVDERQRLFLHQTKIHNHNVIIDGFSLIYFLYVEGHLDVRHGGDYGKFRTIIGNFFENLKKCNLTVFVALDGSYDVNKLSTHLSRRQNTVNCLEIVMSQKVDEIILPLLAGDVFQQILKELKIPFVYSLRDADQDVAALANKLDAYVISNDSDFYIFPVICGYIPLKYLTWDQVLDDEDGFHIYGKVYTAKDFTSTYKLKPSMLPYLSVMLGCDWLASDVFSAFVTRTIEFQKCQLRHRKGKKRTQKSRIDYILQWLSERKTDEEVFEKMNGLISNDNVAIVKWCLDLYRNLPSYPQALYLLKEQFESANPHMTCNFEKVTMDASGDEIRRSEPSESRLTTLARLGKYPLSMCNLAHGNTDILLPVMVGKHCDDSPHRCSYHVRCAAYRLFEDIHAEEYDRRGGNYLKIGAKPNANAAFCNCQSISGIMTLSGHAGPIRDNPEAKKYVLESLLGCDVIKGERHEAFNKFVTSQYETFVASMCYWIINTNPPIQIVYAVIMGAIDKNNVAADEISSEISRKNRNNIDVGAIRRLSEFQSCLKYSITLNGMMGRPLNDPDIAFNCSKIVKLYCSIAELDQHIVLKKVLDCLTCTPTLKRQFVELSSAIYRCSVPLQGTAV